MNTIVVILLLSLCKQSYINSFSLSMAGGRSPAEKLLSKRTMFQDLRSKINTAAQIPGFFEVGDGPADLELYCKSNKDGTQIGDCPFAQFIQVISNTQSSSLLSYIFIIAVPIHFIDNFAHSW